MSNDYVIAVVSDPSRIDGRAWDDLLATQATPTPFMRHAFLSALHASGSATPDTGWHPCFVVMHLGGKLVGAGALHAKDHSYGEYVFDWSWAQAFERSARRYYPKLLGAVPFTPVQGTRLLARDATSRAVLVKAVETLAMDSGMSSAHLLFVDDEDARALQAAGWMLRQGVQFHWEQPTDAPYADFEAFAATMQREKRKKILQERRRVASAGVVLRALEGEAITSKDWDFFYRCYTRTYAEHGSPPYLTRAFFEMVGCTMREHWVLVIASRHGQDIAASLLGKDDATRQVYGRYWGAVEAVPMLHFEACYYAPIEWCIEHRMSRFEGGAQGEHKMARGLMPVATRSAHWIADQDFAQAVARFLDREGAHMASYVDELRQHSPYRGRGGDEP